MVNPVKGKRTLVSARGTGIQLQDEQCDSRSGERTISSSDEHIAQKKAIYERYREGLKDLPVTMNPYDEENSQPNFWLSCMIIEPEAMCRQVRGECEALYITEKRQVMSYRDPETLSAYNAEGRPIWKPMHMQPIYRNNDFITREGSGRAKTNAYISGGALGSDGKPLDVGMDIFQRGLCLPSDNKITEEQQNKIIEIIKNVLSKGESSDGAA